MPIFLSQIQILDEQPEREFETVIKLDEMAAAGVRGTIEFIEGEPEDVREAKMLQISAAVAAQVINEANGEPEKREGACEHIASVKGNRCFICGAKVDAEPTPAARITELEQQLAEANARREAANAALRRAESDHLKACAELDEANAREATLRRLAERLWGKVNERRCDLIKREVAGHASERDLAELAELQAMADDYMHATAPLPIEKLEAYMRAHGIEIPDARQEGGAE